jgi:DNA-binding NarL/FixJ family response regulator
MPFVAARPRLLVVAGHRYLRRLLHDLLQSITTVEVIAELESGMEAVAEYQRLGADMLLMDLHLPDTNGLAVVGVLKQMQPSSRAILIINRPEMRRLALDQGAVDTVLSDRLSSDLGDTLTRNIQQGVDGGTFVP